jgi:Zn-dependent M16 (insulinase) family peptidase
LCNLIPHLSSKELSINVKKDSITRSKLLDVDIYENQATVNGIVYFDLCFPVDLLEPKDYKYLPFYASVLTDLGFDGNSWIESASLSAKYTGDLRVSLFSSSITPFLKENANAVGLENQDLQKAIESKDLKKETAARGRLIKILKKEQNNINHSFKDIQTLANIGKELLKEDASVDKVKEILEEDENKHLYLDFKTQLVDLETFMNAYQKIIEDEEIQRLFFLANLLSDQIQEQRENLDKRFSKEFLDKKNELGLSVSDIIKKTGLPRHTVNNALYYPYIKTDEMMVEQFERKYKKQELVS